MKETESLKHPVDFIYRIEYEYVRGRIEHITAVKNKTIEISYTKLIRQRPLFLLFC